MGSVGMGVSVGIRGGTTDLGPGTDLRRDAGCSATPSDTSRFLVCTDIQSAGQCRQHQRHGYQAADIGVAASDSVVAASVQAGFEALEGLKLQLPTRT